MSRGWIGVDLDGTLAKYDHWISFLHIGEPIPEMVERVKRWLAQGEDVRIFTARIAPREGEDLGAVHVAIVEWCVLHIGQALPITNVKDTYMIELWDDRVVQVQSNTGKVLGKSTRGFD